MNDLIRRLEEQATRKEEFYPAGCNGHPEYRYSFDRAEFARLILEEVTQHLTNIGYDSAREKVEKHFGVN